jgi:hypothetical protein
LPSAFFFVATVCFFASLGNQVKGHHVLSGVFIGGALVFIAAGMTGLRRQR